MASKARYAETLAALLMNCLNLSLAQTVIPTPFKTLSIVPVLKHTTATTLTPLRILQINLFKFSLLNCTRLTLKPYYLPQNLQSAHEVHQFDRDLDELKSWISEKEIMLNSEDRKNDLISVQALIRQHESLEVLSIC